MLEKLGLGGLFWCFGANWHQEFHLFITPFSNKPRVVNIQFHPRVILALHLFQVPINFIYPDSLPSKSKRISDLNLSLQAPPSEIFPSTDSACLPRLRDQNRESAAFLSLLERRQVLWPSIFSAGSRSGARSSQFLIQCPLQVRLFPPRILGAV